MFRLPVPGPDRRLRALTGTGLLNDSLRRRPICPSRRAFLEVAVTYHVHNVGQIKDFDLKDAAEGDTIIFNPDTGRWEAGRSSSRVDGGRSDSVYLPVQLVDGGSSLG